MTTTSKRHEEKAAELIPCPHPVDVATCPFSWNSCRRNRKCDLRAEAIVAFASVEAELVARMMEPSEMMADRALLASPSLPWGQVKSCWRAMLTASAAERGIPIQSAKEGEGPDEKGSGS